MRLIRSTHITSAGWLLDKMDLRCTKSSLVGSTINQTLIMVGLGTRYLLNNKLLGLPALEYTFTGEGNLSPAELN